MTGHVAVYHDDSTYRLFVHERAIRDHLTLAPTRGVWGHYARADLFYVRRITHA